MQKKTVFFQTYLKISEILFRHYTEKNSFITLINIWCIQVYCVFLHPL